MYFIFGVQFSVSTFSLAGLITKMTLPTFPSRKYFSVEVFKENNGFRDIKIFLPIMVLNNK